MSYVKVSPCLDANYWKGIDNHCVRTGIIQMNQPKSCTLTRNTGLKAKRNGQKVYDGAKIRRLIPTECERLQGFPDGWTMEGIDDAGKFIVISDTQRYKCLGNAVTVNVIEAIMQRIKEAKNENRRIFVEY